MQPKEKAEEFIKKYVNLLKKTDKCLAEACKNTLMCQNNWYSCEGWLSYAKQCALIEVTEIIDEYTKNICNTGYDYDFEMRDDRRDYWIEVKQEIEKAINLNI